MFSHFNSVGYIMNNSFIFLVNFILIFSFIHCNQTSEVDLQKQGYLSKISFADKGCVDLTKSVLYLIESEDALHSWDYDKGILNLDFLINSTCGSLFMDETNTAGSVIGIVLTDTAHVHARCTCDFTESFSFSVQGTNQVQIILLIKPYPDHELIKLVDRVITF